MNDIEKDLQTQINVLQTEVLKLQTQLEAYRNAQGQVVNLAFSLIASATVTVIIASVVRK